MSQRIAEKLGIETEIFKRLIDNANAELHVSCPGIVQSFNAEKQTVTVMLAIKEKVIEMDSTLADIPFPILLDVPICIPSAGGFSLTLPVQAGDECLVVFSDLGFDWWYQNGGVQNKTQDLRRHDLSDGFAILGVKSQPNVIPNYSPDSAQLRNNEGTCYINLSADGKLKFKGEASFEDAVTFNDAIIDQN